MDELIILEIEGNANADQLEALRRWRQADEDHERRYREISAVWELTGRRVEIPSDAEVPSPERFTRPALQTTAASAASEAPAPLRSRGRAIGPRRFRAVTGIAAALLVALGVGYFSLSESGPEDSTARFQTGPSELTTAVLDDGTVVRLGPGTTLEVTMRADSRDARLDGRAFFAVESDADRPFRVHTAGGDARVLGTRFEIDSQADRFRLLVLDGRVAMTVRGLESELGAGELGEAAGGSASTVTRVDDPERLLGWMGAWVAFSSTPLSQVGRELEARLGIRFEIEDPTVAARTISGWFAEEDDDHLVDLICRVAGVRCTVEGDVVHVEDRL